MVSNKKVMKSKLSNLPEPAQTSVFLKKNNPPRDFIRNTLNQAASELQLDFSIKVEACMASVDEL